MEKYFCVPDLRGRVIVGVDGGIGRVTDNNTLGASGGEENTILSINQIPKHYHKFIVGGGTVNVGAGSYSIKESEKLDLMSGENPYPHNNMQPYICLNYIINTGVQQNEIVQLKQKINQLEISQQGCAKAWVNFNKDGKINNSYNVSNVIASNGDGFGGDFIVNFNIPFSSTSYCCIGTAATSNYSILTVVQNPKIHTVSSAGFFTVNNLFLKSPPDFVNIVFFGEQ